MGITFNSYGGAEGIERILPFDLIPRVIEASDWRVIEEGLKQRIIALNLFLDDVYSEQTILRDKVIPDYVIKPSRAFLPQCRGLHPPLGIWCHVALTDLVRDADGQFYVLEDNLRCPSGVSYVLENRQVMKRTFPQVFEACRVRPVDDYAGRLLESLQCLAPWSSSPTVAVLTPGVHTAPTSNTPFWLARWASSSWRGKTSSPRTERSSLAESAFRSEQVHSIGATEPTAWRGSGINLPSPTFLGGLPGVEGSPMPEGRFGFRPDENAEVSMRLSGKLSPRNPLCPSHTA